MRLTIICTILFPTVITVIVLVVRKYSIFIIFFLYKLQNSYLSEK